MAPLCPILKRIRSVVDAITTTTAKYLILFRLKMEEVFGDHGDDADIDACSLQTGDSLQDVHGRGTTLHKDGSVYRFTTLIFSDHVASLKIRIVYY